MNEWKKLTQTLREQYGYKGSLALADVKSFLTENGIEPAFASGKSLDDAFTAFKTVTVIADAGEQVVVEEVAAAPEGEAMSDMDEDEEKAAPAPAKSRIKTVGTTMISAAGHRAIADRAKYARRVATKHLIADPDDRPAFDDADKAEAFGSWFKSRLAAMYPGECGHLFGHRDREVVKSYFGTKASTSATLTGGGATVPDEFSADIIELFDDYGVFPQLADRKSMSREVMQFPKVTNEVEVYQPGQNNPITQDDVEWGQVEVIARTVLGLSLHPMSLLEDSAVNFADAVARQFARAHAKKIDFCGFLGDGGATSFGVTGIIPHLLAKDVTPGNIAGIVNAGATWASLTLADFNAVVGRTPQYASGGESWVCSKAFYRTVMEPIMLAAGGSTTPDRENGALRFQFLGAPVYISEVMPKVTANNTVACLYGNFAQGAIYGDRRQLETITSDQRYFDSDQVAIKTRTRWGITVHSLGNASATAALRVAGPIVALRTTA